MTKTWIQDSIDFFTGNEAIDVKSGDFAANPNTRFSGLDLVAYSDVTGSKGKVVFSPSDVVDLRLISKGFFARFFDKTSAWAELTLRSAGRSTVLPIIDQLTPDIIPGQRAVTAWLNGVAAAGVAVAEALSSKDICEFQITFQSRKSLYAATETRFLIKRLPNYFAAIARNSSVKTVAVAHMDE